MQRYRDEDLDEYEDDLEDQYEDADEDQYENEDEEEEEEKDEPLSKEAIEYLENREKIKARHRSILRRENGKNGATINHLKLSSFGNFFGPSQPVIADRVIQESKSLLEIRHLAPKASPCQNDVRKVSVSSTTASKNGPSIRPPPKQVKSKVQLMKQTRDYSFLMSDDAEIPKPAKDPGPQKSLVSKPGHEDARSAQVRANRYEPSSQSGKKRYDGSEQRRPSSGNSQVHDYRNAPPQKTSNKANLPCDSRRQLDLRKQSQPSKQADRSRGSGSRPTVQKGLPPKKPLSSSDRKLPAGSLERKSSTAPVGIKSGVARTSTIDRQRLPMVKPQASGVTNRFENKRDVQRSSESKMVRKENVGASKFQMARQPKQGSLQSNVEKGHHIKKQMPAGRSHNSPAVLDNNSKNKKRKATESESDFDYRSAIRDIFGYRPQRYHDDDDDSDMEAGFDTIMEEEQRSARIAKKEDDEELVKILEEERREALRKKAKMRRR